jgi:glycosyltransferase involved in cell wall biosynthesis
MRIPSISVIIPLYNGAAFIREALESVISQTLKPARTIVVDDGSTDDGPEIVKLIAKDQNISLVHKQNGGQSSARNLGVAMSETPLIAFLDQDDVWYPHHLEELARPFCVTRFPELGWVYSNLDEIDRQGRMIVRRCLDRGPGVEHPKQTLSGCLATDMFVLPTSSLISRAAIERVGGFDESLSGYEDDDLFLRMFCYGYDNVYLKESLAKWRIYLSSSSYSPQMSRSRITYLRKLLETFGADERRGDHYRRELLTPRFFPTLFNEYRLAVQQADPAAIRATVEHLKVLVPYLARRPRLLMRMAMPMMARRWPSTLAAGLAHMNLPVIGRLSRFVLR